MAAEAKAIMSTIRNKGGTVPLPVDLICAKRFAPDAAAVEKSLGQLDDDDMILDIGHKSAKGLAALIEGAGTVLWNGPAGVFEFAQFSNGTRIIGEAIARSGAFSIAGGGDTLAAVAQFGLTTGIDYISTGGGAFLEFLEGKTLPAVAILEERGQ
jgi:phosphoglycerate kinase